MKSLAVLLALVAAASSLAAAAPENSKSNALPSTARETVPCQWVDNEGAHVQETLNRFDSALASHDVQQLQAAGIEPVSAKGWQRFFRDNPRATVTDSCPESELSISGDTASWNCIERSTIISEGKPVPYVRIIHFTFTKRSGEWMISDRK